MVCSACGCAAKCHAVTAAQGERVTDGYQTAGCAGKIKVKCCGLAVHIQPRRQRQFSGRGGERAEVVDQFTTAGEKSPASGNRYRPADRSLPGNAAMDARRLQPIVTAARAV